MLQPEHKILVISKRENWFNTQSTDYFFQSEGIVAPPGSCRPVHLAKSPCWKQLLNKRVAQKDSQPVPLYCNPFFIFCVLYESIRFNREHTKPFGGDSAALQRVYSPVVVLQSVHQLQDSTDAANGGVYGGGADELWREVRV